MSPKEAYDLAVVNLQKAKDEFKEARKALIESDKLVSYLTPNTPEGVAAFERQVQFARADVKFHERRRFYTLQRVQRVPPSER